MSTRIIGGLRRSRSIFDCIRGYVFGSLKVDPHSTLSSTNISASSGNRTKINIDGVNINYVRIGDGSHPLLCLPGAMGSIWTDFPKQLDSLDSKLFTVLAWDAPGCGHSRPPDRDHSPGFYHRDAEMAMKFMMALKIPRFSLLGWSDGGITALIMAAKYPHLIRKCVVWGANSYIVEQEALMFKKIRDINMWSDRIREEMITLYGREQFRKMCEEWVDSLLYTFNNEKGNICKEEIKLIQCPVFVLHGARDPLVAAEHPQYLVDNIPNARLTVFPEGGHSIHLSNRSSLEFNKLVTEFLVEDSNDISPGVKGKSLSGLENKL